MTDESESPNIVLVVGAGASADFGFPTGDQLMDQLITFMSPQGPEEFGRRLNLACPNHPVERAINALNRTHARSIDEFLKGASVPIRNLVRTAMADVLLTAERNFSLQNIRARNNSWYDYVWRTVFPDAEKPVSPIAVVTFNYDRSLELYSYRVASQFSLKRQSDDPITKPPFEIVHVHGALGPTDIASRWWDGNMVEISAEAVRVAGSTIRVYHESHSDPQVERAQLLVRNAKQLVFLGFGFHQANLQTLGLDQPRSYVLPPIASAYRFSEEDKTRVKATMGCDIHWGHTEHKSLELLRHHVKNLGVPFGNWSV